MAIEFYARIIRKENESARHLHTHRIKSPEKYKWKLVNGNVLQLT